MELRDRPSKYWTLLWWAFFTLGVLFGFGYDTAAKSSPQSFSFASLGQRQFALDCVGTLFWGPVVGLFEWLRFGHIRLRRPFWMYSPFESLGSSQLALFSATFLGALGLTIVLAIPIVGGATAALGVLFLAMAILLIVGIRVAVLLYGSKPPPDD